MWQNTIYKQDVQHSPHFNREKAIQSVAWEENFSVSLFKYQFVTAEKFMEKE